MGDYDQLTEAELLDCIERSKGTPFYAVALAYHAEYHQRLAKYLEINNKVAALYALRPGEPGYVAAKASALCALRESNGVKES
jgi:hypothetical protein